MAIPRYFGCCVLFASVSASAATFEVRPVSANVAFSISGNTITLPEGMAEPALVDFEVYVSGWGPQLLGGAQATPLITGGSGGGLLAYTPACSSSPQCPPLVGPGSACSNSMCGFGSFLTARPDFLFGATPIFAVSAPHAVGAAVTNLANSIADSGTTKYFATMRLVIAAGSTGTFTVSFTPQGNPNPTFWSNNSSQGFFPTIVPALVSFDSVGLGVPAVGSWGLLVLALAVSSAATLRLRRVQAI